MSETKKDEKSSDSKQQLSAEEKAQQEQAEQKAKEQETLQKVLDDDNASDEEKRAAELALRDHTVGVDGVNPITPNNPPKGSQPEVSRPHD